MQATRLPCMLVLLAAAASLAPATAAFHDCGGLRTPTATAELCDTESASAGCDATRCWESHASSRVLHVGAGAEGVRTDTYVTVFERSYCENDEVTAPYCSGYDGYGAGGSTTTPATGTVYHGATLVSYRTHDDGFESCQTYLFASAVEHVGLLVHDGCDVTLLPLA